MQTTLAQGLDLFVAMNTSDAWSTPSNGVIADYEPSSKGGHAIRNVIHRRSRTTK